MGLLDDIIEGASSDGVTTTNLLRKVQTVARRVGATELLDWVRAELDGYADTAPLPLYRGPFPAAVRATWSGPYGSSATSMISAAGTPESMKPLFEERFRQGLPEIEVLAAKDDELGHPWNSYALAQYNRLVQEKKVPRFEMMGVYSAHSIVTPASLKSIVESVRTKALDLALDLQAVDPMAGELGGPTRADPGVANAITVNINHIYGDGANVAQGTGITQTSSVTRGDVAGLAQALASLLSDPRAIGEAIAIITGDDPDSEKRSKLQKVGDAIRRGGISLATGITSDVAASGLLELAGQFLGW